MLRDKAYEYMVGQGCNCAETLLHVADDALHLELTDETYKALGVFGRGLACGNLCGALAAACGVLGTLYSTGEFHKSPEAELKVKTFMLRAQEELGDTQCAVLRPRYFEPGVRCLHLVERAADMLEELL